MFVCSRNQWRSLTAEKMFANHPFFQVKSAGTEASARVRVNAKMLDWAQMVFVMEKHHRDKLLQRFPRQMESKKVVVLEIPDVYQLMDKELMDELQTAVQVYVST